MNDLLDASFGTQILISRFFRSHSRLKMANIRDEMVLGNKLEVGLARTRDTFDPKHPIEVSEKNFRQDDSGLCRTLRLQIERSAAAQIGHLPFISQRSSFQVTIFYSPVVLKNVNLL